GEQTCNGFSVARSIIRQLKDISFERGGESPGGAAAHDLYLAVCMRCPFFENDCDFASWKRGESPEKSGGDVNPCGGLLFLAEAIDRSAIDIQAVYRVT
ncbi:MAG TPA: hypothetical protein VEP69_03805, partial [Thermodesulfovibrionales bacterium]|nr:hypothetical protein [Thermodesulfovibrionales bacterium]